jgi:hypothetical protein
MKYRGFTGLLMCELLGLGDFGILFSRWHT